MCGELRIRLSDMLCESEPQNRHCISAVNFVDKHMTTSKLFQFTQITSKSVEFVVLPLHLYSCVAYFTQLQERSIYNDRVVNEVVLVTLSNGVEGALSNVTNPGGLNGTTFL